MKNKLIPKHQKGGEVRYNEAIKHSLELADSRLHQLGKQIRTGIHKIIIQSPAYSIYKTQQNQDIAKQMESRKEAEKLINSIPGIKNRMIANFNQIVEKQPVSTPYGYTYDPPTPTQDVQPKNDNSKQKTESSKSQSNTNETPVESTKKK